MVVCSWMVAQLYSTEHVIMFVIIEMHSWLMHVEEATHTVHPGTNDVSYSISYDVVNPNLIILIAVQCIIDLGIQL